MKRTKQIYLTLNKINIHISQRKIAMQKNNFCNLTYIYEMKELRNMRKGAMLLQHTFLYAIAHVSHAAANFLLLPLYTHYFNPEAFGFWDITITTITLLIPIVTLELTSATYRWLIVTN